MLVVGGGKCWVGEEGRESEDVLTAVKLSSWIESFEIIINLVRI